MKTAIFTALVLATLVSLQAADKTAPLTPRARANAARVGTGEEIETLDRSFPSGSPRANQNASPRKIAKGSSTNTLDRNLTGMAAKARDTKPSKTTSSSPEK